MNKNELNNLLATVIYGDIFKSPHSVLIENNLYPSNADKLDEEQNIRVSIAATLKKMLQPTEKCAFCNSEDTVTFGEHYTFCKECSSIYTQMMLLEKNCDHITDNSLYVLRLPWFKKLQNVTPYIHVVDGNAVCSMCGESVLSDGW